MNMWQEHRSYTGSQEKNCSRFVRKVTKTVGEIIIGFSCVLAVGCSSPPEPTPSPSKEEIRSDADRFFEKLKKEGESKAEKKP